MNKDMAYVKPGGLFIALLVVLSSCSGNSAPAQQEVAVTEEPAAGAGKILYESKCMVCHGTDGTASIGGAANLQRSTLDAAAVLQQITNGKGAMPSFKASLSEDGIQQVAAYIKTLRK